MPKPSCIYFHFPPSNYAGCFVASTVTQIKNGNLGRNSAGTVGCLGSINRRSLCQNVGRVREAALQRCALNS